MRLSKQTDTNQNGKRSEDHHNTNPHHFKNWNVNKPANMHGHLARSLHTASDTRGLSSIESQWTRFHFTPEEESHREWESKRQACFKAMARLKARLRASNEVEDDFVLVDAPSMADSAFQISQPEHNAVIKTNDSANNGISLDVKAQSSLDTTSPNTRRQLKARQGTYLSRSNKARIGVKKKSPIAVRFRRANSIPLETKLRRPSRAMNTNHGNPPTPGSIVTAEISTAQPSSQESMTSKSDSDFTFVDWFIVAMFVVQSIIWINLGCLFISVLRS
ncbi:hypothetical protein BHE90_010709 [Fusarium euwallaceae]|uniref:Uncharacterized protein n=1 Tax=Fusarium euwallaceae TaxID=1147111 RepID=A0A430LGM1_9HYPO|nr:hypothetical protein BHE90_010709 [Fusarium euwallaceae]